MEGLRTVATCFCKHGLGDIWRERDRQEKSPGVIADTLTEIRKRCLSSTVRDKSVQRQFSCVMEHRSFFLYALCYVFGWCSVGG